MNNIINHLSDCSIIWVHWISIFVVLLSFVLVIWRVICATRNATPESRRIKYLWSLASIMFFVWALGFFLYICAIEGNDELKCCGKNAEISVLEFIFRSAVASVGMFAFNIDSNIFDNINQCPLLRGTISVCSFVAGVLTIWILIELFGARILESLKTWWGTHKTYEDELCVFFGINEATRLLADSINKDAKDRRFRLVFVEFPIVDDEEADYGLGAIMKSVTHRVDTFRVAKRHNARLSIANSRPNGIKAPSNDSPLTVFQRIGLGDISKIIRNTNNRIHLFFLSEDEAFNIESVAILKRDATIIEKSANYECKFYCHTRHNSIHRVIQNETSKSGIEVKIIDSSRLSVDLLKNKKELHPVNYVEIQDDATVSSPFNALVVGFGEVGLDAVRFLYEFGAFVKSGSPVTNIVRSDFHCDVVDRNMPDLAGPFIANAPAINTGLSFMDEKEDDHSLITLHKMDCQSVDFYLQLKRWIKHLNYVVIATGNDEMNISLAVRIFRLAIRHETNFELFRILVRVKHDENGHFGKIAQYYNRLWAADMKKDECDILKRQKTVSSNAIVDSPITLFGSVEDIYKYDYIVSDDLLNQAKLFKERYDMSVQALQIQSGNKADETMSWDAENKTYMQLEGEYEGYSPTFSNVMKLRRVQSQNYENCYHVFTKQRLAMCALGADEYNALTNHQLFRRNNETTYTWKTGIRHKEKLTKVLDTLAQTEHLRWNASHEILGYQDHGDETFKDEARLYHGCLKSWDALSDYTKSFDYNVVDVSLNIIEIKQTENNVQ